MNVSPMAGLGILMASVVAVAQESAPSLAAPRLTGIVNCNGKKWALLELPFGPRPVQSILQKGDAQFGWQLEAIDEAAAEATLQHEGRQVKVQVSGASPLPGRALILRQARLDQVLEVYQDLTGWTVLRSESLPAVNLDAQAGAGLGAAEVAMQLEKALGAKELIRHRIHEKFVCVLHPGETNLLPALPTLQLKASDEILPAGLMKFTAANLQQALEVYGDLAGLTLLQTASLPPVKVTVRTASALTRSEAAWMLEALFHLRGVSVVQADAFALVYPRETFAREQLPHFDEAAALAKARMRLEQPETLRILDAPAETLLTRYASLIGRAPEPLPPNLPAVRLTLRSHRALRQAEAIFALEALAFLNHLRFELVGENSVRLVHLATRGPVRQLPEAR